MFGIGVGLEKIVLLSMLALIVVGPKDLPKLLYVLGQWLGKMQRFAAEFRQGLSSLTQVEELRQAQAELERIKQQINNDPPSEGRS
jgi:sec-independent protein translocase protein TatB